MRVILYIFLVFTFMSCDQKQLEINANNIQLKKENGVLLYKNHIFSGVVIAKYVNSDQVKSRKIYKKGRLDGEQKSWYPNDTLFSVRNYRGGVKVGKHEGFWMNGHKKFEYYFNENGEHHGALNEWFENGEPYRVFNYVKGKEQGSQKMFKPNGELRSNYVVKNNDRFGLIGLKKCDAVPTP